MCGDTASIQSCLGKEREIKSLSTKQIPQPGKLQLCWTMSPLPCPPCSHASGPSPGADLPGASEALPTRQVEGVVEKGIRDLVPVRSPVGWRWAYSKVSQTFGQCVFLRVWSRRMDSSHPEDAGTAHYVFLVIGSSPFPQAACLTSPSEQTLTAL